MRVFPEKIDLSLWLYIIPLMFLLKQIVLSVLFWKYFYRAQMHIQLVLMREWI